MTDNEIIKMLENEADFDCGICCDNGENCLGEECASLISRAALDLINRQKSEIARLQTAVAPVRHGRWKKSKGNERPTENGFVHDDRYVCDCCGWGCCCETKLDFSFCPNCGARMDGDADANGNDNKTPET